MASRRGHPEHPVPGDSPARELAEYLRGLRRAAGVTYRQMAVTVPCRHNTLSQTADGRRTGWPPVATYLRALRAAAPGRIPDEADARARRLGEEAIARSVAPDPERPGRTEDRSAGSSTALAGVAGPGRPDRLADPEPPEPGERPRRIRRLIGQVLRRS